MRHRWIRPTRESRVKIKLIPLADFPDYYATEDGRIFSRRSMSPTEMAGWVDADGYRQVSLSPRNRRRMNRMPKRFPVHVLVALAFHGPKPAPHCEVRHLDGIRSNNASYNLCWGTRADNGHDKVLHGNSLRGERNPRAKVTYSEVLQIKDAYGDGLPQRVIGLRFGLSQAQVSRIVRGEHWRKEG